MYWNHIVKILWRKSPALKMFLKVSLQKMSPVTVARLCIILLHYYYSCINVKAGFYCCTWLSRSSFWTILYTTATDDYFHCDIILLFFSVKRMFCMKRFWQTVSKCRHNDSNRKVTPSQRLFWPTNSTKLKIIENKLT